MVVREALQAVVGKWVGSNQVILYPGAAPLISQIECFVSEIILGKFIELDYHWDESGPQAGKMWIGRGNTDGAVKLAWLDSWHNQERMMTLTGSLNDSGRVAATGSYPAEGSHPDWGWRIELDATQKDAFVIQMFNITPDGQEALAIESMLKRA